MWTDRQDAKLILRLMLEDRLPQIWVASWENRDLRQLLWHRHRMVQARMLTTRSGNWWCGDLHPTRFAALSAAPAKLRLIGYSKERGILRLQIEFPRTAARSTPTRSSPPLARAGKLCSFRRSTPSLRKGIPQ